MRMPSITANLTELADQFLADYFAFYPTTASNLGLHEYDGQIVDMRPTAIAAHIERMRSYDHQLQQIDPTHLERLAFFDYALLRWQVDAELWRWTIEREYTYNPIIYTYNAMVDVYVQRDYAPLPERIAALTRHLQQIPDTINIAQQNLQLSLPRVLIEETINILSGLTTFLTTTLPATLEPLITAQQAAVLWQARDEAITGLDTFHHYLVTRLMPASHPTFALGPKRFCAMLRYNELIDLPIDRLLAVGEADLQRNKTAIERLAYQIDPTRSVQEQMIALGRNHPDADQLIAETQNLLDDLRQFVVDRDLVTLPHNTHCIVTETPPFARWAFAMMDTAGPFERHATESFYFITLPEAHWSSNEVAGWLTKFDYATLTDVSMHEAYPGHYVHFANLRNAPTRVAKVFAAYSHYESWAHYVEQMMLEQGYQADNRLLRLAQLAEALMRNCRYICAIKMHTQGMSIEEATRFFMANAYMDEVTASKEARRGTHDPGYINYTLGKLLLLKLLNDYKAAHGSAFSLKRFHDEYISYGSPPIPLLRKMLLPYDNGHIL